MESTIPGGAKPTYPKYGKNQESAELTQLAVAPTNLPSMLLSTQYKKGMLGVNSGSSKRDFQL